MKKLPLLLAEPISLIRQTVALTAGSIRIGPVLQASTLGMAQKMVLDQPFAGIIVSLNWDDDPSMGAVLEFIAALRSGGTLCAPTVPVFVTASTCSAEQAKELVNLDVQRVLIKPFKARLLIDALAELAHAVDDDHSRETGIAVAKQA